MKKYQSFLTIILVSLIFVFFGCDNDTNEPADEKNYFWEPTGLEDLSVKALFIISNNIFAGTSEVGIFHSTDNGNIWRNTDYGLNRNKIISFGIWKDEYILAGTNRGGIYYSAGVYDSWGYGGMGSKTVNSIYWSSSTGYTFSAVSDEGIFRSENVRPGWRNVSQGFFYRAYSLLINSKDEIFTGSNGAVFRSSDKGENWTKLDNGLPSDVVNVLVANSDDHIFAGPFGKGIYKSIDNGETWTQINTGLTNLYVNALAVNSSDNIFAGTENGVFYSVDNGETWTQDNTGLTNLSVNALAVNSADYIFAGTENGVFRSTEPTTSN